MSAPESLLLKIKLLLNLKKSANVHEAENASIMVDKLILKYNITKEELKSIEDKKPLYGEDDKLFSTIGLVGWRQQLALSVGKHFDCQIVQEELVPLDGEHQFNYFVYGNPEDSYNVKFVYHAFTKQVELLFNTNCIGKGPVYLSSYGEGVVETIKGNIDWEGIKLPDISKPLQTDSTLNNGNSNLSKVKEEREKPTENSVDVNSQSLIEDVTAYFKGVADGKDIFLKNVLEIESLNKGILDK